MCGQNEIVLISHRYETVNASMRVTCVRESLIFLFEETERSEPCLNGKERKHRVTIARSH